MTTQVYYSYDSANESKLVISDNSTGSGGNEGPSYDDRYAYLYDNLRSYFLVWYLPVVLTVGLLGTAFCLTFLFLSKLFPRSMLLWLVSICVGDFMILVWDGLRMMLKVWFRYDFRDQGRGICKLHLFLSNFFFYWSAYMQAGMSLQRLYLIVRPLQARTALPFKRLLIGWGICTCLLTLPHLPYLLVWDIRDGDCDPSDKWYFYITTLSDMILWGIIPMASMTVSTGIISWNVIRFQTNFGGKVAKPRTTRSMSEGTVLHTSSSTTANVTTNSCDEAKCGRRHGGSDTASHVTKLLISMNLWYMVTTYPLLIYFMHLNFGLENQVGVTIPKQVHRFCYYFLRALCYLNSCSNWIFYCALGRVFRKRAQRILYRIFCCKVPEPQSQTLAGRRATVTGPMRPLVHPPPHQDSSSLRDHSVDKGCHRWHRREREASL